MQPPPPAASVGAGGPPPLAASQNAYWRNGPFSRRANAQVSPAAGPVQPVTDPFAFGRQAPPQGAPKGSLPGAPGFSLGTFPPPAGTRSHPQAGDNSHGRLPSASAPLAQPRANSTFSPPAAPLSLLPAHVTNASAGVPPTAVPGLQDAPPSQAYATGASRGNPLSGHEGLASVPDRLQGAHRPPGEPSPVPAALPVFPPARQMVPQWKTAQGSLQPPGQGHLSYPEPLPQNASYAVPQPAVGLFQSGPPQSSPQPAGVPNPTQVPLISSDAPSMADLQSTFQNVAWQSPGMAAARPGQLSQEHFYLQPLGTGYGLGHPTTQENSPAAQPLPEAGAGQCPAEADSGTVSMFFKGDEAENEEILSSGKYGHIGPTDLDPFQQSVGHTYYQPLYTQQAPAATSSEGLANPPPPAEAPQQAADVQQPPRTACGPRDLQAHHPPALRGEGEAALAESHGPLGPPYENVENLECVQNQEVPPSELLPHPSMSPAAVSEPYRRASLPGPPLSTNSSASHLEGGPNLEAPDSLPQPVRPDSVSSDYSSLSHRSASSSARPQEPQGTFIQQESGRPEEESSARFFKQLDSSPLGPASDPSQSRNYHSGLSQALTPSPPKPMGVFQTSANSSFEPVRSHGLVAKPTEVDQAKMVVELAENQAHRKGTKKSPVVPVASLGNLEQPPDNLETLFMPQAHPLPLTAAGSALPPGGGALLENIPSTPEKRPSARAPGAKKQCESPATTLWASNELPNFGGNVLLAPAAPAVYVPAKQTVQVVQPPDQRLPPHPPPSKLGSAFLPPPMAGNASSENLENPPKVGDDEALYSQASSGYASLLSSPPTEALQNQPILMAQPHWSPPSAQPAHVPPGNPANQNDTSRLAQDPGLGSQPLLGMHPGSAPPGETGVLPVAQPGSLLPTPLASAAVLQGGSANLLGPPTSQLPLNLAPEGPKAAAGSEFADKPGATTSSSQSNASPALAPPAGSAWPASNHGRLPESSKAQASSGALDFTVAKASEHSGRGQGPPSQASLGFPSLAHPAPGQVEPEAHSQQRFYEQVTKDAQQPVQLDRATPSAPPLHPRGSPGGGPAPSPKPCPAGPLDGSAVQPPASHCQATADSRPLSLGQPASAAATTGLPSAPAPAGPGSRPHAPPSQPEQQHPQGAQVPPNVFGPPPNSYNYYYKTPYPYDPYQSPYQPPYPLPPLGPRTAHLYYQVECPLPACPFFPRRLSSVAATMAVEGMAAGGGVLAESQESGWGEGDSGQQKLFWGFGS